MEVTEAETETELVQVQVQVKIEKAGAETTTNSSEMVEPILELEGGKSVMKEESEKRDELVPKPDESKEPEGDLGGGSQPEKEDTPEKKSEGEPKKGIKAVVRRMWGAKSV